MAAGRPRLAHAQRLAGARAPLREAFTEVCRLLMDLRAVQAFEASFVVPGEPPKARLVISDRKA